MTIAISLVTPEGVVLGADSTTTFARNGSGWHLNNEQKIFEVGESGSLGVLTWGLGRVGRTSHRTRIAALAQGLTKSPPKDLADAAQRLADQIWPDYDADFQSDAEAKQLRDALANPSAFPAPIVEIAKTTLAGASLGFCVAGCLEPGGPVGAFEVAFNAALSAAPVPTPVPNLGIWGHSLFVYRVFGIELGPAQDIMASGKWQGTKAELDALLTARKTPLEVDIPLREAIDAVYTLIQMTIKVMKFTALPPVCGGPIEIAAVTTDRRFRWVRHKSLDAAIGPS